jgi:hypothetical protein
VDRLRSYQYSCGRCGGRGARSIPQVPKGKAMHGADEPSPFLTGPKTDDWLVHMVGLVARGFSWCGVIRNRTHAPEAMVLAIGRHWPPAV